MHKKNNLNFFSSSCFRNPLVYKNTGLKEGRREGRQEGRQEGIQAVVELLQEMELEKEVICGKVQEKFHISSQEAAQEVEKYWK